MRTKYDWSKVDWTKKNAAIAKEIGAGPGHVMLMRSKIHPGTKSPKMTPEEAVLKKRQWVSNYLKSEKGSAMKKRSSKKWRESGGDKKAAAKIRSSRIEKNQVVELVNVKCLECGMVLNKIEACASGFRQFRRMKDRGICGECRKGFGDETES